MNFAHALYLCFVAATAVLGADFPADIPRCRVADTACISRTTMNLVRQYGRKGYPAAAFPVIEPFYIKKADLSDGREGSVSLKLHFRDLFVDGLSAVQVDRAVGFDRDPSKSKFEMYGSFPKLELRGKYNADGRILILPIRGDGDANIVLHHPKFSVKFKPSVSKRNGKTFLGVEKFKVLVEPERMSIQLTNLFNGDKALGSNLNQFLNDNWHDVWNELQESIHATIGEVIQSILLTLFKQFAYEDLFSDY